MSFFKDKKVLVTGGTGMIGKPLVDLLLNEGANVSVVSLDESSRANPNVQFKKADLCEFSTCLSACEGQNYVFHLAGIKGSPKMTKEKPASFFFPTISFNTNMMEAARRQGVERFLYTSTIGVYSPSEVFKEDDVWQTFPSPNDRFAGWAKRMGELQAEAYKIEYGWDKISIVRPANVYGPHDNFNPETAMVIPSLIQRVENGENPLKVWGDGSAIRDFIFSRDVARGMMHVLETGYNKPLNLGSGVGYSIKQIAELIVRNISPETKIAWDTSQPTGDKSRLMDMSRAKSIGFSLETSLEQGIMETINWYKENKGHVLNRHDQFKI